MAKHSEGEPHIPTGDLGGFAPTGEPKNLTDQGAADTGDGEFDAALKEFAGISKKHRLSSVTAHGKADIPKEGQKSSYNDPPQG